MSKQRKRRPVTSEAASTRSSSTVIVTRKLGPWRARRQRHLARVELDQQLGTGPDLWAFAAGGLDWSAIHMDRDVPAREAIGRDYAVAGWMP